MNQSDGWFMHHDDCYVMLVGKHVDCNNDLLLKLVFSFFNFLYYLKSWLPLIIVSKYLAVVCVKLS